ILYPIVPVFYYLLKKVSDNVWLKMEAVPKPQQYSKQIYNNLYLNALINYAM
ncbi:hypothetical protein L9F63_011016, partial [Diploptera punctata]